jgi:transcriptional regulator of acetoin/glycerol metabolism
VALGQTDGLDSLGPREKARVPAPPELPHGMTALAEVMEAIEKKHILTVLETCRWHRGRAASALGVDRKTLFKKMKKYGI